MSPTSSVPPARPRPVALVALALILTLEAVAVTVIGVIVSLVGLAGPNPASGLAAGLTLIVTAALLSAVAVGTVRARPWTRSATLVWQVVQLLVGLYQFQGQGPAVAFGVAAGVPAVVALVLLFTRSVRAATARPSR